MMKRLAALLLACTPLFAQSPSDVVAQIGERKITAAEVSGAASSQLEAAENQLLQCKADYERNRHTAMESIVRESVRKQVVAAEAKATNTTPEAVLAGLTVPAVTTAQLDAFYEENKGRVPPGVTKEQVLPQIRDFLEGQARHDAEEAFYKALETKHHAQYLLGPHRTNISGSGPARGPANAPVKIVEFSDFECPFCGQFNPSLEKVRAEFGDKVRIEFRQYPLPNHANAQKAAEAGLCADEQGKFWEMHDAMFKDRAKLSVPDLKAHAAELKLDTARFNACLDSGKTANRVREDMKAAAAAGVSGTPAVFVNGRLVGGALPPAELVAAVREELARKP
jgi:predicted DsbA family dithiol-disulfide isomerase